MWRLLSFLFTGYWGPAPSQRRLRDDVDRLEERFDYLVREFRRLRGTVTGGVRYAGEDADEDETDFPTSEFNRMLALKQGRTASE